MKNKHLVLMFLGIVILGWFGRKINWGLGTDLQAHLCKSTASELFKIVIINTDTIEMVQSEGTWIGGLDEENLLLPDSVVQPILQTITGMESIKLLKTNKPDSLGFNNSDAVIIQCFSRSKSGAQTFILGKKTTISGNVATWVAIPGHEQYYLAKGDLKLPLKIHWDQLKLVRRFLVDTTGITQATLMLPHDTVHFYLGQPGADSLLPWLNRFYQMTINAPEADFFDVEHGDQPRAAEVQFVTDTFNVPATYYIYYAAAPVIPDDPARLKAFKNFKPQYVIASGKNPGSFFAIDDTALVKAVMRLH